MDVFDGSGRYLRNLDQPSTTLGAIDLWFDGKTTLYVLTYNKVSKVDIGPSSAS